MRNSDGYKWHRQWLARRLEIADRLIGREGWDAGFTRAQKWMAVALTLGMLLIPSFATQAQERYWFGVIEARAPSTINGGRYWLMTGAWENQPACERYVSSVLGGAMAKVLGYRRGNCQLITFRQLSTANPTRWWGVAVSPDSFYVIGGPLPTRKDCDWILSLIRRIGDPREVYCTNETDVSFVPPS